MADPVTVPRTPGTRSPDESVCHTLPAGAKLVLTLLAILAAGLIPLEHWPAQGLLLAVVFTGLSLAGVTMRYLARRLALFVQLQHAIPTRRAELVIQPRIPKTRLQPRRSRSQIPSLNPKPLTIDIARWELTVRRTENLSHGMTELRRRGIP